ncbi:hypothetical protein BTO05_06125 [Winogradskyella sp. PC-19]|jgi:hypothetical protein|uniref:hypothetical protein n=1 Tax=unclassified Winogradskyella TaxID=2615021 RepID=UPI000B3D3CC9|nr:MULTISPECIES: hypothetical protein [unclassified Winogradskyella]ARV09239.1 hypothetical protein BTO05_06125 [Winogradskyella sp. PC-19]RZN82445.1 MAG: hypothetical protein EVB12_02910 [Winogradskyella sp.]
MSKLKLECHEANHICDKNQYKEATFMEKVILTIHLMYCRACRKYTAKNTKLTKLIKNPKVETLDDSAKNKLQQAFEAELGKQQ